MKNSQEPCGSQSFRRILRVHPILVFSSVISVMQSRFFHNTFSEFLFLEVLESPNLFVCFYKCHLNVVEPERLGHALNLSPQLKSHNINISGSQRNAKETR